MTSAPPSTVVRECARVLKPGGRLLLSTPNVLGLASRWRYFRTGFFRLARRSINEHCRSPVHDRIHLIAYHQLRYILRTTGSNHRGRNHGPAPQVRPAARVGLAGAAARHPAGARGRARPAPARGQPRDRRPHALARAPLRRTLLVTARKSG